MARFFVIQAQPPPLLEETRQLWPSHLFFQVTGHLGSPNHKIRGTDPYTCLARTMDPTLIAGLGLIIGLALLIIEFFIPSGGLIFVVACASLAAGVWGAWQAWADVSMVYFWTYVGTLTVLAPSAMFGGLYLLDNTSLGDRVLLTPPTIDEVDGFERESNKLRELIGKRGKALGLLNPGGMVIVEDLRYHCETPGMLVDPGTEIEVIDVSGNRLVVRVPFESETSHDIGLATTEDEPSAGTQQPADGVESFDFDIPEDNQGTTT